MGVHLHLDIVGGVHVVPDGLFELIGCFAQFSLIFFWNSDLVQRRGLPDTFRSILLHFSEKLAEVARDVLNFIRIDRAFERLRFLHRATNGGHILRVSLSMFQHEATHGVVHLILRGNARSQNTLLIERDLAGQLCEFRIFQKQQEPVPTPMG